VALLLPVHCQWLLLVFLISELSAMQLQLQLLGPAAPFALFGPCQLQLPNA
jgi:hypothetical protein